MISLTCMNCRAVIEMDDGFAGGVCRCMHCGAIQTVPTRSKGAASKTLYKKTSRNQISDSDLHQLAHAVASSSGLNSPRLRAATIEKKSSQAMRITTIALILIFAGLIGAWFLMTHQTSSLPVSIPHLLAVDSPPANFCGTPISGKLVIYLIDRGSGTAELFSYLKEATFKSAESLGRDRKFQIIFWNNGSDDAYPQAGPAFATPQNIDAGRHLLDGITAHGQSDVRSALSKAIALSPDLIVLASGKGDQLDDGFTQAVLRIRNKHPVKIDTFDVGESQISRPMQDIAQSTGGKTRLVDVSDLKTIVAE